MTNANTVTKTIIRRTHTIKLRVSIDELEKLQALAADMALATFIREELLKNDPGKSNRQYKRSPVRKARNDKCELLTREIAKIGNNLNQLARVANTSLKNNQPINNVVLASRLYLIWEELHVLQNIQTR